MLQPEDLSHVALSAAANGIMITDLSGEVIWVNASFSDLTGWGPDDAIGRKASFLKSGLHPQSFYARLWRRLIAGEIWAGEMVNRRKDGGFYVEEQSIAPIRDPAGTITHFIAIKQDVTKRKRSEDSLRRQVRDLKALHGLAILGAESKADLDALLGKAAEVIGEALSSDWLGVGLLDDSRRWLRLFAWASGALQLRTVSATQGVLGKVFADGGPIRLAADPRQTLGPVTLSAYCVPLRLCDRAIGIICAESYRPRQFSGADEALFSALASQLSTLIEKVQLFGRVHLLATTDALTGLYNRLQLFDFADRELERARRYRRPVALIMLDIDHFKGVNDRFGHATGDAVLRAVADCCREMLRDGDLLGRYGGEEFIALLPETDGARAMQVAERLREGVGALSVAGSQGDIGVTISIGVAEHAALDHDLARLLAQADEALYAAKHAGRDRVRLFHPRRAAR